MLFFSLPASFSQSLFQLRVTLTIDNRGCQPFEAAWRSIPVMCGTLRREGVLGQQQLDGGSSLAAPACACLRQGGLRPAWRPGGLLVGRGQGEVLIHRVTALKLQAWHWQVQQEAGRSVRGRHKAALNGGLSYNPCGAADTGPNGQYRPCWRHHAVPAAHTKGRLKGLGVPLPRVCPTSHPLLTAASPAVALTMQQGLPSRPQSGGFCTHLSPLPQTAPMAHMGGTSLSTEKP